MTIVYNESKKNFVFNSKGNSYFKTRNNSVSGADTVISGSSGKCFVRELAVKSAMLMSLRLWLGQEEEEKEGWRTARLELETPPREEEKAKQGGLQWN